MSCAPCTGGRKRESEVWRYFDYMKAVEKVDVTLLMNLQSKCGHLLAGKNPKNLTHTSADGM
jgi:hypothetical protein